MLVVKVQTLKVAGIKELGNLTSGKFLVLSNENPIAFVGWILLK